MNNSAPRPFDAPTRQELMDDYWQLQGRLAKLEEALEADGATDASEMDPLTERSLEIATAYRAGTPRHEIARDPLSDLVVTCAVDTFGLDGLWWNYHAPLRPVQDTPSNLLAVTGSLQLAENVESTRFFVSPGPEVPFVVPRLLVLGATAVVSRLPVGRHTAHVISYFADPTQFRGASVNTWGTNHCWTQRSDGSAGWDQQHPGDEDLDFDLAFWISRGKLAWIAPEDDSLKLQADTASCPFLDLAGSREPVRLLGEYAR